MGKFIDITGQQFERLFVVKRIGSNARGNALWLCRCNCKNKKTIIVRSIDLRNSKVRSCGCLQKEITRQRSWKHGHRVQRTMSPTYMSWSGMIQRCTNPHYNEYEYYGGRGIVVCERWRKFSNFLKDMGNPPTDKHSIDRINNSGDYCKSNCCWSTPKEQARNTRRNHLLTFRGKTQCIAAWADETGILQSTILMRVRRGWTVKRALTNKP